MHANHQSNNRTPAAVIARSIPLEIADILLESGSGLTLEEMCVATGRSEAEIRKHAAEGRRLARNRATRSH